MKLSIIIPYYNGDKYVGDILDDLVQQGLSPEEYEIIVIDDGSMEETVVLNGYCLQYSQIRHVRYGHLGISEARNKGIEIAHGDYMVFCDCDDRVRRNAFGQIVNLATERDLEILFFNIFYLNETDNYQPSVIPNGIELSEEITPGKNYFAKHPRMPYTPWHFIISKKFLKESGIQFSKDAIGIEDQLFVLEILLASSRVSLADIEVYGYYTRNNSYSNMLGEKAKCKKFQKGRLFYIKEAMGIISIHPNLICTNSIKRRISHVSFQILHDGLLYLSVNESLEYIRQLKKIKAYPISSDYESHQHPWVRWIMNNIPLWSVCCWLFKLLPESLRKKAL